MVLFRFTYHNEDPGIDDTEMEFFNTIQIIKNMEIGTIISKKYIKIINQIV